MNPQQNSIKHSALGWVKKSIDDNLAEITTDLKLYIEEDDVALLDSVKERLAMVQGVLMMIEQYGAAMLTEEMVSLCDFIVEQKDQQGNQSLEVLLRAVLQLPDYLEHIQSGHRDIPIAILPLLNDIRSVKNQDLFSEKLLFLPDLSVHNEDSEDGAIDDRSNQGSKLLAKKLRPIYQYALLNVIRDTAIEESLKRLEKVCETLEERSYSEQVARIWWIIGALIESVSRQQLELGVSIKNLLGKVDALFRVILIIGERGLVKRQPVELIKNFLFYIAQPECDGPKAQAIKTAYRLEQFLPSEAARSKVMENIVGPNQALLKTVAEAMKADIEAVKSTLEVYVNGDLNNFELLQDIPQELHIISDTLAMIGLGQQRQLIEAHIEMVKELIAGKHAASEEKLLSMAAELIQVEQALEVMQKRQPVREDGEASETSASEDFELDNVLSAVVTATLDNIQKTKSAILEFIKDSTRGDNIELCVALMEESKGALALLNQQRAVAVVDGLLQYLKNHDIVEFMDAGRLDALSQVVVSLEYYLEALGEHRSDADSILDFADTQIQQLLSGASARESAALEPELVILADEDNAESGDGATQEFSRLLEDQDLPEPELASVDPDLPVLEEDSAEVEDDGATREFSRLLADDEAKEQADESDVTLMVLDEDKTTDEDDDGATREFSRLLGEQESNAAKSESAQTPDLEPIVAGEISLEAEPEVPVAQDSDDEPVAGGKDQQIVGQLGDELESLHSVLDVAVEQPEADNEDADQVPAAIDVVPNNEVLEVLKPGSDPEILEIYLEEAEEESENIRRLQQDWLLHPEDENALKNARRAFHTIKGSGRLVGALKIAEFAWDFEQLLNRVIDKTVYPSVEVIEVVGFAANALPELVEEIKTGQVPTSDIPHLRGLVSALAAFNANRVLREHGRQQRSVESPDDHISETSSSGPQADSDEEAEPERGGSTRQSGGARDNEIAEETPDPLVATIGTDLPGKEAEANTNQNQEPPEATVLSFDPELLTIYQQEVEQHLSTVNSALDHAEKIGELIPNEEIYRALHTIHGASRTADIRSIGELASLLEKPLKAALAQSMTLDQEIITLYRQGYQALKEMTSELVATRKLPAIPPDLETSLRALAEDFEEYTVEFSVNMEQQTGKFIDTLSMMNQPSAEQEQDNELLAIFVDEANELLEMSDQILHQWSEQKVDASGQIDFTAVMELQRYLHTLKGGAKMADLGQIGDLSHELESMFIAIIDNRVEINDELIDLLKDSFDLLHRQVTEAQENKPQSESGEQVTLLQQMRMSSQQDRRKRGGKEEDREDPDADAESRGGDPGIGFGRQSQEVIKVRSDLLDNLVNSAGEVSIYRARMEQQVVGLGSHLGELGQTIGRLKNQLRSLEAETDAQIHFSHRISAEAAGDFDPLEMDRYTMIQELSRSLGESVNDLSSLQGMLGEQVKDSETLLLQQSRVNTDLQDGLIKSRMVKFSGLLSRLRRLVRQSSQELAKKADLVVSGEENEVDNKVLDRMVAPLEHIIRNALAHGIEKPVDRVKKGKPEVGVIKIDISRDGSDIVVKVSDDGAGVNLEKVRKRALQQGLIVENQVIADGDLVQYILEPGFSTADHVTQMSGRGVGMDVVDIEIKQLGGTLQIETSPQGSLFIARLPFTLSINQAILVRSGEETYAIPLMNIEGITRVETSKLMEQFQLDEPVLDYAGQKFSLHNLSMLVGGGSQIRPEEAETKQPVILSRSGDMRLAFHVDEILGNREIVVKSLGKQLSQVKGLSGASILADGSVVLILDLAGLVRHSIGNTVKIVYSTAEQDAASKVKARQTVMVVDDSITMRRVASKLLERHNYEVVTAKDGVDALAQLEDVRPDVMLLDIEMPRMDGFELATHMQNEKLYSKIPIIMITSRTGEKHRDRAYDIGVSNYMGKPYQESELIENIQRALGGQ